MHCVFWLYSLAYRSNDQARMFHSPAYCGSPLVLNASIGLHMDTDKASTRTTENRIQKDDEMRFILTRWPDSLKLTDEKMADFHMLANFHFRLYGRRVKVLSRRELRQKYCLSDELRTLRFGFH